MCGVPAPPVPGGCGAAETGYIHYVYARFRPLSNSTGNDLMIIISGGMPRSGSRWYRRVTHGLLVKAGYPSVKELKEMYGSEMAMQPSLQPGIKIHTLMKFDRLAKQGLTFTVKTHTPPTLAIQWYLRTDRFTGTYTYRDPRDAIVSALERGEAMRNEKTGVRFMGIGPYRSFARLHTLEGAIAWMRWMQIPNCLRWLRTNNVLVSRYEDIRQDTFGQIRRLSEFLDLGLNDEQIGDVIEEFDSSGRKDQRKQSRGGGKIINKGVVGRHKEVFSPSEQELLRKKLGKYIVEMGYTL